MTQQRLKVHKKEFGRRTVVLKERILSFFDKVPKRELTVVKLFYDGFD